MEEVKEIPCTCQALLEELQKAFKELEARIELFNERSSHKI